MEESFISEETEYLIEDVETSPNKKKSRNKKIANLPVVCRGLKVDKKKLTLIRSVVSKYWKYGRTRISLELCRDLDHLQENGWPKDRAMRDILRRLEALELISLPPPLLSRKKAKIEREAAPIWVDETLLTSANWTDLEIQRVSGGQNSKIWNQLISDHHYLGRKPIVGRNLRQLVFLRDRPISCLAWSDPCLKLAPRDRFLEKILAPESLQVSQGVNNNRFLILPWVNIPNLASKVLSIAKRHMRMHWQEYYNSELRWAETFVDPSRFRGTCYKAANWKAVGRTAGTARSGFSNRRIVHGVAKDIYVYVF